MPLFFLIVGMAFGAVLGVLACWDWYERRDRAELRNYRAAYQKAVSRAEEAEADLDAVSFERNQLQHKLASIVKIVEANE